MKYNKKIIKAKFIKRPNRFNAVVKIDGVETIVHVPNTGRCKELLYEGVTVLLREENNEKRKTKYDLICVYKKDQLICIDSQIPNKVVKEALRNKAVDKLKNYTIIESEKFYENSRFDFRLAMENGKEYYLEVKGVTLENNGFAMFPDAPTERGTKHIRELIKAKQEGKGAGVLFLVQMEMISKFSPNYETDIKFSEALKEAHKCGVDIFVYNCIVTEDEITMNKSVELLVDL